MKVLPRQLADKLFDERWTAMRGEWFKLEVLQDYYGEDKGPPLNAWLTGDKAKAIDLIKTADYSDWVQDCQAKLKQGVNLQRIHVVEQPYTPYIEFEIEHYKSVNIPKCGEKVYLLDKAQTSGLNLPDGDLMIFDGKRAVVNTYDDTGFMTQATFYDEQDDISEFLTLRTQLLHLAKPLKL